MCAELLECPLLALSGHFDRIRLCPLLDQSRQKWILACDGLSANDPKRTLTSGVWTGLRCVGLMARARLCLHGFLGGRGEISRASNTSSMRTILSLKPVPNIRRQQRLPRR
jgi:hypothetical protein